MEVPTNLLVRAPNIFLQEFSDLKPSRLARREL